MNQARPIRPLRSDLRARLVRVHESPRPGSASRANALRDCIRVQVRLRPDEHVVRSRPEPGGARQHVDVERLHRCRGPLSTRYGCMNRRFCSSFSVKTVSCMLSASMIISFTSGTNSVRDRVASACPSSPNPRLL